MRVLAVVCFAFMLLISCAPKAEAGILTATVSPASHNISLTGASSFVVTWTLSRTPTATPYTVQSQLGKLRANINMLTPWSTTGSLSRVYTVNVGTVTFTETVVVPPFVARKALESNGGKLIYSRDFTDDNFATTFQVVANLNVTGGAAGALNVSASNLMFDNGSSSASVGKGAALSAKAVLDVTGSGLLRAVWEVDNTGGNNNFYRPLKEVSQTFAGQRTITLKSPDLPTQEQGRYNVRLRILAPVTGASSREGIVYFVTTQKGQDDSLRLPLIAVKSPEEGGKATAGTVFAWNAVKEAAGYKIEIFEAGSSMVEPVAKMMVRGNTTQTTLSALTLSHIVAPASCKWRVTAFDKEGRSLAMSAPRLVRIP